MSGPLRRTVRDAARRAVALGGSVIAHIEGEDWAVVLSDVHLLWLVSSSPLDVDPSTAVVVPLDHGRRAYCWRYVPVRDDPIFSLLDSDVLEVWAPSGDSWL